ncbi:TetR/AcrR family transcriptional regulator [Nigerium massiliense]|uniref:TetR/AcrR family transcriptional regulator n=1 Tax=Nigerium massiliense TaxID=1522317 RepID=UPI00058CE277|nr:TetR/AcrR family transcriptional regulator [Nigerium massiliense]
MKPRVDRSPRRRLDADTRRVAILDAARRLFAASGYGKVSVDDVAEAAEASPALVFRYFGSKAGLYTAVLSRLLAEVEERQRASDAALPPNVSARDRVRASLEVYLDHVAEQPDAWAATTLGAEEPREATQARRAAQRERTAQLRSWLGSGEWARHAYAVDGYAGFVDHACALWAERGCPGDEREAVIAACLGCLEGALGDWAA